MVDAGDGVRLWAETRGRGPHLLLAHGGPGVYDYLGGVAALFEDVCTVTRFDQRGCGRSEGAGGPFTVEQAVADVEAVRRAVGAERWVAGGHSWGASLALLWALAHPERAAGVLYIAGVGIEWPRWKPHHEAEARRRRQAANDAPWSAESTDPAIVAQIDQMLTEAGLEENQRANRELNESFYAHGPEMLAGARVLQVPVLLIEGADDPRPNAAADSLVQALPNVERVTLSGAGHFPWFERREDFAAVVRGWLARVNEAPASP